MRISSIINIAVLVVFLIFSCTSCAPRYMGTEGVEQLEKARAYKAQKKDDVLCQFAGECIMEERQGPGRMRYAPHPEIFFYAAECLSSGYSYSEQFHVRFTQETLYEHAALCGDQNARLQLEKKSGIFITPLFREKKKNNRLYLEPLNAQTTFSRDRYGKLIEPNYYCGYEERDMGTAEWILLSPVLLVVAVVAIPVLLVTCPIVFLTTGELSCRLIN